MTTPSEPADSTTQPWQGTRAERTSTVARLRLFVSRCFWPLLLVTSISLFATYIWLLTLAPKRTPLILISSQPYSWPLPPTKWSREQAEQLGTLNGQTISLIGSESPVRTRQEFLRRLRNGLSDSSTHAASLPQIIVLNVHGVAGGDDQPAYLIPPGGSPVDEETWVGLGEVLNVIGEVASARQTLLVLDCQHMAANWNIGLSQNRFFEAANRSIQKWLERAENAEKIAILFPCGRGEQATYSEHLQSSIFSHFFRLGLAGAADQTQDGWVSLSELDQFVSERVSTWTRRHRGDIQRPMMIRTTESLDFKLTRSLNQSAREIEIDARPSESKPIVKSDQLESLWSELHRLRAAKLYQNEPIAFAALEHRLLSLEQLSRSGAAYRDAAASLASDLRSALTKIEDRRTRARRSPDIQHVFAIIDDEAPRYPNTLPVHSLALAEMFGCESLKSLTSIHEALLEFEKQPSRQSLSSVLKRLSVAGVEENSTAQFFRMLRRYQTPRLWERASDLARLTRLQRDVHALAVYSLAEDGREDGRLHCWIRQLMRSVDDSRRDAEDYAFLSDEVAFATRLNKLEDDILQCREQIGWVREALESSDAAAVSAGYFAQWIDAVAHEEFAAERGKLQVTLVKLFDTNERLAEALSLENLADAGSNIEQIVSLSDALKDQVQHLNDRLNQQSRWLIERGKLDDPTVIGAIDHLCGLPLLDPSTRKELRSARDELAKRVFDLGGTDFDAEATDGTSPSKAVWATHPLDLLLPADDTRPWNARSAAFSARVASQTEDAETQTALADRRRNQLNLANRLRVAAPIWFPAPTADPIAKLRTTNLQELLVWHANRSIKDFWGPAGRSRPFYDVAASDYCVAASKLQSLGIVAGPICDEIAQVTSLLQSTRRFLPNWLATSAAPGIRIDTNGRIRSELTVLSNQPADFAAPSGTASVTVRDEETSIELAQVMPSDAVVLPTIGGHYTMTLPNSIADDGERLVAQAMFRGHEYGRPLRLAQLGGYKVRVAPDLATSSTVTVSDGSEGASIAIILDGSASMGDALESKTKLALAKAGLNQLLTQIAARGDTRVSLRVFGHRVGWSTTAPLQRLQRPGVGGLGEDVLPSRDVEALLPLKSFGVQEMRQLQSRVAEVKPWGQSPLYLAVTQALEEFGSSDNSKRHLIVITDGENYQFAPPSDANFQPTTADDVLRLSRATDVPIHILGLGVDEAREPAAVQEFEQLGRDSGGGFQTLTSETDLNSTLERLLLRPHYQVKSMDRAERPAHEARLGNELAVQVGQDTPEDFEVRVEGDSDAAIAEAISLEGGEAIELFVQDAELLAYPFDQDVVHQTRLLDAEGQPANLVLRVHRPRRLASGEAEFTVSWQLAEDVSDSRWKATPRPVSYWVEIRPLDENSQLLGAPFVFYDRQFEPKVAVPLAKLVAESWPDHAKRANVRVWVNPHQTNALALKAPAEVANDAIPGIHDVVTFDSSKEEPRLLSGQTFVQMESLPGDEASGFCHRFVVRCDDGTLPVSSFKIQARNAEPMRIVRQFDHEHQLAVHRFYYESADAAPDDYLITDQITETSDSLRSAEGSIEIVVPEVGGLLPVGVSARRAQLNR